MVDSKRYSEILKIFKNKSKKVLKRLFLSGFQDFLFGADNRT